MAGIELIFSTICNATFCDVLNDNFNTGPILTAKQNEIINLKNEVNGKHLRIGTYNNYPLSWVEKSENGTLIGRGVAFVLVDILKERFNFTFEVVVPEKNFLLGGKLPQESLLGLVNSSRVDMGAAFFPILVKYNKMVTYSDNLDEGVWMMMLKRPKESAAGSGLLAPFDTYVWYLILAAVLTYGPFITLLTWLRSKLIQDAEGYVSLPPSAWFVYGAFIKQGTSLSPEATLNLYCQSQGDVIATNGTFIYHSPVTPYHVDIPFLIRICKTHENDFIYSENTTRVSFATWWLFIMLLSAFYTANLTAFLTLSKFTLDIENPIDLYKKNYRWVAAEGGAVQYTIKNPEEDLYYLNRMVVNRRAQIRSVSDNKEFLSIVSGGAVLVTEQTAVDNLMYDDYLKKTREGVAEADRCTYVIAPNAFMKKQRAFAYPKNTTLKVLFDTVLTYLIQSGIVGFLEHRDLPSTKICPLDLQSKDRQLRNTDLMMTYFIIVTGLAVAVVVFVGEITINRYIKGSGKDQTQKKSKKRSTSTRISHHDDSRPPPYDSLFGRARYKLSQNSERKIINGREYYVVNNKNGDTRLIPVRTPSAFLYR